jgi:hypothetical protein
MLESNSLCCLMLVINVCPFFLCFVLWHVVFSTISGSSLMPSIWLYNVFPALLVRDSYVSMHATVHRYAEHSPTGALRMAQTYLSIGLAA